VNRPSFTSSDVAESDSICGWINHSNEVETFHELFFNIMYDPDMAIKYKFLSLCMAIESYFGYYYPNKKHMDNSDWESLRDEIFEVIPDEAEAADRLKGLIGNIGNDYSLKDKLDVITKEHSDVISECFDRESALEDIHNTRNDIAHGYGGDLAGSKTNKDKLIPLLFKTRIIVEICMYDVIGLSDKKILAIIESKYKTSSLE